MGGMLDENQILFTYLISAPISLSISIWNQIAYFFYLTESKNSLDTIW
jgi:hypothetical protein